MEPLKISASIVVYKNDCKDIVAAIESVLSAPLRVCCTVVDNSPSPDLKHCVEAAGATYLFAGKNLGFGSGHNLVLREISDDVPYHLVLNPDVAFSGEILSSLVEFMNGHPDVGLVMPKILYVDGTEQRLCKQLPSPLDLFSRRFLGEAGRKIFAAQLDRYELKHLDFRIPREVPCLSGCFMFLRSDAIREVGGFDERYFMYMEDVDLCRKLGLRYKTVFYPRVAITHGYAKGSYSNHILLKHHVKSALRYFMKWGWIFDQGRRTQNNKTAPVGSNKSRQSG